MVMLVCIEGFPTLEAVTVYVVAAETVESVEEAEMSQFAVFRVRPSGSDGLTEQAVRAPPSLVAWSLHRAGTVDEL